MPDPIIMGMDFRRTEFIYYLKHTFIPDLKESGNLETAKDFEMCIELMDQKPIPGTIDDLQESLVKGPINHCVYDIFKGLQQGDMDFVQRMYQVESDKIHSYYKDVLIRVIGCRQHLVKNCQSERCVK